MPIPFIGAVLGIGEKLIDRLIPDPIKKQEALLALKEMEQRGELAQIAVNLEEAKHPSLFVSGWRPFIGWVCGSAFAYNYIVQPFFGFVVAVFSWEYPPLPSLDISQMTTVLMGMLGLAGMRSYEKRNNVENRHG